MQSFRDFLVTLPDSIYKGEEFDFCVSFPGNTYDGVVDVTMTMNSKDSKIEYPTETFLSGI